MKYLILLLVSTVISCASYSNKNLNHSEYQLPPATTYRYISVNGAKIFYREAGDPSNTTIVLLHGYPSSSHTYRNLIPMLSLYYHVIAPDNLGSGYSEHIDPDSLTYSFDVLAEYTQGLLDGLGIKQYVMYMQDFGAPVGYRMMMKDPKKIKALIVQNANAYLDGLVPKRQKFFKNANEDRSPENLNKLYSYTGADTIINGQYLFDIPKNSRYIMSPDAWTHDLHHLASKSDREIQVQLFQDYYNNLLRYPKWQNMLRIEQPKTLIVWGSKDLKFTADGAKAYLRDLPDAELHLLDAGHFAAEEKTSEIANLILDFLQRNL